MFRQRLRVLFTKEGPLRFISHHDLMRLFERALRRTGLPLKLSEGFNPRPQLSFPVALALGIESCAEVFEVELTEWVSPGGAKAKLEREVPEGIGIKGVESVDYRGKAEVIGSGFSIRMSRPPEDFLARLRAFLDTGEVLVERKRKSGTKTVNVRPFVRGARFESGRLELDLASSSAGAARPEEVLEGILKGPADSVAPLDITRVRLDLAPPP